MKSALKLAAEFQLPGVQFKVANKR